MKGTQVQDVRRQHLEEAVAEEPPRGVTWSQK
ncbi:hypothetical protein AK812_SmicGene48223, partial [Symbiodinium microadriaticum]